MIPVLVVLSILILVTMALLARHVDASLQALAFAAVAEINITPVGG